MLTEGDRVMIYWERQFYARRRVPWRVSHREKTIVERAIGIYRFAGGARIIEVSALWDQADYVATTRSDSRY